MNSNASKQEPQVMTDKHKGIIVGNFDQLTSDLRVDPVLDQLVKKELITTTEAEEIEQEKTAPKKARSLVRLLLKLDDRAFSVVIDACERNSMAALAKRLRDADTDEAAGRVEEERNFDPDIVVLTYDDTKYEVDTDSDGAIHPLAIGLLLPKDVEVRGLQYINPATGNRRIMPPINGRLGPPKNGWGSLEYTVLTNVQRGNSTSQEQQSAKVKQEDGKKEDEHVQKTPDHRAILERKRDVLSSSVMPSGVMMHLRRLGVMKPKDQEDIEHGKGPSAQAEALVDFILKKDYSAFEKFCEALTESNQAYLARILKAE